MTLRVRVHSPGVETLLRLEREEHRLAERMQRDAIRRATLRPLILTARCSLNASEAREYEAWLRFRSEATRREKETA